MNDAFITGFVKTAIELGADDMTIACLFKQAMEDPNVNSMFKQNLVQNNVNEPVQPPVDEQAQLQQMEELNQLMQQNPQLFANLPQYNR